MAGQQETIVMPEFKGLEQPRINIDVGYQISIMYLSENPKDEDDFLRKLSKQAAENGEGDHHARINDVHVKYNVLLTTLSLPLKMKYKEA